MCNVSRLWRFVAHSTPALWSSISVTHSELRLWPSRALIRSWVKRSKGSPLSFELVVEDTHYLPSYDMSIQAINEIFLLFLFQFERWQHVRIVVPLAAHLNVQCISPHGVSMLESLHIRVDKSHKALEFLPLITDRSPQLRSLIWQLREHPKPPMGDDTLQRLTELYLECMLSPAECLAVLKTCPNLCICELENICITTPTSGLRPDTVIPFKHATIHTLRLETNVDISTLLGCLALPSLISLAIAITDPTSIGRWTPWQLSGLLLRSSSPLESLLLENLPVEEEEMVACLELLPNLSQLNITSESFQTSRLTNRIICALGDEFTSSAQFICPKLEVIKLCGDVASNDGVFSNMVVERWNAASTSPHIKRLKTVQAEFSNGAHALDNARLKALRAEGLVARIFTRNQAPLAM